MCISPIKRLVTLLYASIFFQLISLPQIAADYTPLENLYNLVDDGKKGSCDSHLSDLKTSYAEGLAMAKAAIDAIDAVEGGKRTNWLPGSKNNKKAKMLQAMWQIKGAGLTHGISSEDSDNLDKVRKNYQNIIDTANELSSASSLYCGDEYFNYYKPDDEDLSYIGMKDPKPTLGEQIPDMFSADVYHDLTKLTSTGLKDFGGWWDGEINWFKSKKLDEQRSAVLCSSGTGAFTIYRYQSITWCPASFDGFGNGHKYLTSIGAIKNDQNQIKKNDQLKNYESLAGVWVHEWTHLQSQTNDEPAYHLDGSPVPNGKSYGFYLCATLAKKSKSQAVTNADTYAYFAMAMYLDAWDWSEGRAMS